MTDALIELRGVGKKYANAHGGITVLRDVNLKIRKGEILSVVGSSGCGKTTLVRLLANIISPTSGKLMFQGSDIENARTRGLIGYVPQSVSLMPFRTVIRNVRLPLELRNSKDEQRIIELIKLCGLENFENYYPVQLSGGMKQKVAIARALAVHPEVLLLDEPFASIDEMAREKLNEEVLRIRASIGMSIVYITHNIEEAVFLSDRIAVLSKKTGTLSDVVEINLPKNRDALVRVGADFFTETVKVRHLLKNA